MYTEKYITYVMRKLAAYLQKNLADSIGSTISDLNGTVNDRLVVYKKTSSAEMQGDTHVWTLYFAIDEQTGDIVAYLDADDNDLLRSSVIKRFNISVSEESLREAFPEIAAFVNEFYSDKKVLYKYIDDITSKYSDEETATLSNELDKRDQWEQTINWTNKKQKDLERARIVLKRTVSAYKIAKSELDDLMEQKAMANNDAIVTAASVNQDPDGMEFDEEYIDRQIAEKQEELRGLTRTYKLYKDIIEELEYDKAKYLNYCKKYDKVDIKPQINADGTVNAVPTEQPAEQPAARMHTRKRMAKRGDFADDIAANVQKAKKAVKAKSKANKTDFASLLAGI